MFVNWPIKKNTKFPKNITNTNTIYYNSSYTKTHKQANLTQTPNPIHIIPQPQLVSSLLPNIPINLSRQLTNPNIPTTNRHPHIEITTHKCIPRSTVFNFCRCEGQKEPTHQHQHIRHKYKPHKLMHREVFISYW